MLILFAPLFSVIALAVSAATSVVSFLLRRPGRLRADLERPFVEMPPVPWPEAAAELEQNGVAYRLREPVPALR